MALRTISALLATCVVALLVALAAWLALRDAQSVDPAAQAHDAAGPSEMPTPATWTLTGCVYVDGRFRAATPVEVDGRRIETDELGQFEVADLPWREVDVIAWLEDHTVDTQRIAPGGRAEMRVRALRTITGRVHLPDGTPVPGHRVVLRLSHAGARDATTDGAGRFAFEGVPPGLHHVHAAAYAGTHVAYLAAGANTGAGTADMDLELPAGDAFRGVVRAPDGSPVADAVAYARFRAHGSRANGERTRTNELGEFALVVPDGKECTVIVETPTPEDGWRFVRWFRHGIEPDDGPLDVRLEEGHAIAGRVVGDRGVDVAGREIRAYRDGKRLVTSGRVKQDGTFRVGGLWEASYGLRVSGATGIDDPLISTPNRTIASGAEDVVIRLHRARPLGGRVLDANGDPLARAVIYALQSDLRFTAKARTDQDGTFTFHRVPPASLRIRVRPGGKIGSDVEAGTWRGGDTNVDIRLDD